MLCRVCSPAPLPHAGVTHWQSPNYFSWFPGNTSMPGVLAEMLIAALNMVGFSWQSSPVSTELEMVSVGRAGHQGERGSSALSQGGRCLCGSVHMNPPLCPGAADLQFTSSVSLCLLCVTLCSHR